jgi:hypothetical protein
VCQLLSLSQLFKKLISLQAFWQTQRKSLKLGTIGQFRELNSQR